MITARQHIPTQAERKVLHVFPLQDKNHGKGGRVEYSVDRTAAEFVRTIRDIKADPMVTASTTTKELYAMYPKLRKSARPVLWKTLRDINWDLEYPLAMIGCVLYRETPKSKTACIDIGKTTLRF